MRRRFWVPAILLLLVNWSHAFQWDASQFMSIDEIQPGMKATAHTVFSGIEVETFDAEVVSIRGVGQGQHIIWCKGQGERIEHTGVAQGMSGSPVYINRRLIGAVAYTYGSVKDAWAGITPIGEMLPILDRDMTPRLSSASRSFGIADYLETVSALRKGEVRLPTPGAVSHGISDSPPERLKLPLMLSGFQPGAEEFLKPFLAGHQLVPVQGGGVDRQDSEFPLAPGNIVAMVYATGDQTIGGYGTVTYRDGDRFLAYGHPADNQGHTAYPISGGWVDHVIASRVISTKQTSLGRIAGTLVQDRSSGIAGFVGEAPSMAPLKVNLTTESGATEEFNYDVFLGDPNLAPTVAGILVRNSIQSSERGTGDYTVDVQMKLSLADHEPIANHLVASGYSAPATAAYLSVYAPLSVLVRNEFTPLTVTGMSVDVTLRDQRDVALIQEVRLNKSIFRPGEVISATVMLRPYLETPIDQHIQVQIPHDAADGVLSLLITNPVSHQTWQQSRAPDNYRPRTVDQLLDILREGESSNHIVSELFVPKLGMTVQGEEFPELPFSMLYVMSSPTQSGEGAFTRGTTLSVEHHPAQFVIVGSHTLRITIDRDAM